MKKHARRPGKPKRPVQPGLKLNPTSPRDRLIAAIADVMARKAARASASGADPDAELLRLCAIVKPEKIDPDIVIPDNWDLQLLRVSNMPAQTLGGLRAKLKIGVMFVGVQPDPSDEAGDFDRRVPWLMLTELLELVDDAMANEAGQQADSTQAG